MLSSTCQADDTFGPAVSGCRDDFDLTVQFELLFFSALPSAVFILLSLWRVAILARRPSIVKGSGLQQVKMVTIAIYVGLQTASLIFTGMESVSVTSLSIASSTLRLLASLWMLPLSSLDHARSPRPSVLLSSYLFLTTLFDAAQVRTLWLASGTRSELTYACVFTTSTAVKVLILVLEAQRKAKWMQWDDKEHSPEETSGIFSLGVFFWLNKLFLAGYHHVLHIEDLYPLDHSMAGEALHEKFIEHVDYAKLKGDKHGLLKVLARTLRVALLLPILPRLALMGFMFCQPFFINKLIEYLSEPEPSANVGYGFIGASICIYAGIALSTALYWYFQMRMLYMARGCLVTAIYTKATEAKLTTSEESASLTLMSTDIERIFFGFRGMHDLWANVIEVGLASWLLYNQLGAAFAASIVIVLICTLLLSVVVRFTGGSQRAWMTRVQERVGLTAGVIANMKNLKISGLTTPVRDLLQKLRVDELAAASRFRWLLVLSALAAFTPGLVSPFMTFAVAQRTLGPARLFTSLSYLLLLATPLQQSFQMIPALMAGLTCLSRIQKFLECESLEDFRTVLDGLETQAVEAYSEEGHAPLSNESKSPSSITIRNGHFGWRAESTVLRGIHVDIPRGSLTIVIGPVASGKSTLCKALLGEVPVNQGSIALDTRYPRIGYCDQIPFLSNGTIKQNIIGFSPFDAKRYAEVIDATMLAIDFESLPQGDESSIGSNGISLSGGQKQRVSLARALYLHTDLLILDDIFTGLDADTEKEVSERVFGLGGIIRRRHATVVLCTHSVRHLPSSDHIIALAANGSIEEQGSFEDLIANPDGLVSSLGVKSSSSEASSEETEVDSTSQKRRLVRSDEATKTTNSISQEDKSRQVGDKTVYKHYLKSMGYPLAAATFFWTACFGFFYNYPNIWLKYWSDNASDGYPAQSSGFYAGIYALLELCCMISLTAPAILVFITSVKRVGATLHHQALNTLTRAPLTFFTSTDQGVITNLFSQDLNLVDTELMIAFLNVLYAVFVAIGQGAVMLTTSPYIAISYPFLILLLWFVQKFYLRTSRQLRLLDLEAKSPLYTHFLDTAKGILTLRAFGFIAEDRAKNIQLLDTSQRPAYLLAMVQQWLTLVLNVVVMFVAVVLTSLAVKLRSNSGFAGASLVTLMNFGDNLTCIVLYYTQLETSLGAVARLKTFSETVKPEDRETEDLTPKEEWPHQGAVELRGVSASYESEKPNNEKPSLALDSICLSISPGEKVAICGRTGSGKSSLISLLLKLLDPLHDSSAEILIDGMPLQRLDRSILRGRIIAIPQDTVFLPNGSTFQANLDPFNIATADECQSVLEAVDLWSFVQERGGLDAGMIPNTMSQGQRQIFSLARAVLRRRLRARKLEVSCGGSEGGILLLDEVSSSVDRETESVMLEIIRSEFRHYTVIAVSHRLDMIMDFDRVIVMDKGQVVEEGNPRRLVEEKGTRFGDLWRSSGH